MLGKTSRQTSFDNLPKSTFCSDPKATHVVNILSNDYGSGVYGYYTNEFDAHRVKNWFQKNSDAFVEVEPYSSTAPVVPGIHPLIELTIGI